MVNSKGAHSEVGWEQGRVPSGLGRMSLQGAGARAVPTQRLQGGGCGVGIYREERMQKEEATEGRGCWGCCMGMGGRREKQVRRQEGEAGGGGASGGEAARKGSGQEESSHPFSLCQAPLL